MTRPLSSRLMTREVNITVAPLSRYLIKGQSPEERPTGNPGRLPGPARARQRGLDSSPSLNQTTVDRVHS